MSSLPISHEAVPATDKVFRPHGIGVPREFLELIPAAVYICDRDGLILQYNRHAAELWGREPKLGDPAERFCGSYRLYRLDGGPVPHDTCPMADALRTGTPVHDQEVVIERPDGSRVIAMVNIDVIHDDSGVVIGAVNCFQDVTERRQAHSALRHRERQWHDMLQALPVAVYMTDAEGRITFYNEAAAELWGQRPEIGKNEFCGSWKLFWPDGTPLRHDECPMALALKERRSNRGMEAMAERPDGTRVPFLPYPMPLWGDNGELVGALNTLVDISDHKRADDTALRLAALVEGSNDAIVSKTLQGIITSWNDAAERLFGYRPEEAIGRSITMLIPEERLEEEDMILSKIGRGERIDHFETVRRRKDGSLVEVSLTISPIRNAAGKIVGASKIARDITERKQAEEQKNLLFREMNHRIKNLFAVTSGLVSLTARTAGTPEDMAAALQGRLRALAQAYELTLADIAAGSGQAAATTGLDALLRMILAPFADEAGAASRIVAAGPAVAIAGSAVTNIALLFHEFATNAAKYGALSKPEGNIRIEWAVTAAELRLAWREQDGPALAGEPDHAGFGDHLARGTAAQLDARIDREWTPRGLVIHLTAPLDRLAM